MILTTVLSGAGAIALLLIWRHMSVARGARRRDEALSSRLAPLAARLEAKQPVAQDEVAHLAGSPELRQMLYAMCSHYQRLDLFPAEFLRKERQAEAVLAYWLQHPNELQSAPEALEYLETIQHPYGSAAAPYESVAGAFSRASDVFGRANAQELVQRYARMHQRR